jgi:hypothetical protein
MTIAVAPPRPDYRAIRAPREGISRIVTLRFFLAFPMALACPVSGCLGGNLASNLATAPQYAPKDQTKCGVTKSQERPLIVEWPSSDRMALETRTRQGIVVVHYVGCEMEVLQRCQVAAPYSYFGGNRKVDKVVMKDADDLYANLPVGAAGLESKLEHSGKLTVAMNLVGRYEAAKSTVLPEELQGECEGATHFVYGITVGAFDFFAGGEATVGATAKVGGAGAGGHSESERETLTTDGDVAACEQSSPDDKGPPAECGALIRIEVVPLGQAKRFAPTCPGGTKWDGSQCVGQKVVTQVDCPQGSKWDGTKCAADATCTSGSHFETGRGCVPDMIDRNFH